MRCPELPCDRQAFGIRVDGDDRITSRSLGSHDCRQTNRPDPPHADALPFTGPVHVEHRARTGEQTTPQWPKDVDGQSVVDLYRIPCTGDSVSGERGLSEPTSMDFPFATMQCRRPVETGTEVVERGKQLAVRRVSGSTTGALAAVVESEYHVIADH